MKRWSAITLASLCCVVAADLALGGQLPKTLRGPIDRGGRVAIEISKDRIQDTRMERYRWKFRKISVRCAGGRYTARRAVTGGFAINAAYGGPVFDWGIQGTMDGDPGDPTYATKVRGTLVSWEKARGWIRLWGSEIPLRGGGRAECDSGRLRWVARD